MKRRQTIEIFAPTAGRKHDAPSTEIDIRSMPDGNNGKMYYGVNQKEYGTTLYATGSGSTLGAPTNFLYEAKYPNSSSLQVFTHTAMSKFSSGGDNFVVDGQTYTGTFTDFWSGVMHNDAFVFTNGVNPLQIKASISATGTNMQSAINTNTYKAWAVTSFRDHLNLYHTIENGTEYYKRVRWTKKGALVYSAGSTDFNSGVAGAQDIQECEGEIKTAVTLGVAQAIYCERAIIIQTWVGGTEVYRFTKTISGVGTPSRRGVASYGDANFFVGADNFWQYMGGSDLRSIGDPIQRFAFGEINNSSLGTAFVEIDPTMKEVLFHVPVNSDSNPSIVWVYRLENESWARREMTYTCNGQFTRKTGKTIGELVGDIGAQNFPYNDYSIRVESNVRLWGDQSGRVVKDDKTVYSLSNSGTASPQNFSYVTPDIVGLPIGGHVTDPADKDRVYYTSTNKRYTQFTFEALGNGTANVAYSTNGGSTFVTFPTSPVTCSPGGTTHVLDLDVSAEMARFKITNTATNEYVGVRYAKVEIVPGSES